MTNSDGGLDVPETLEHTQPSDEAIQLKRIADALELLVANLFPETAPKHPVEEMMDRLRHAERKPGTNAFEPGGPMDVGINRQ